MISIFLRQAAIPAAISQDGEPNPILSGHGGNSFTLVCPNA
jgi:hypothetical protein